MAICLKMLPVSPNSIVPDHDCKIMARREFLIAISTLALLTLFGIASLTTSNHFFPGPAVLATAKARSAIRAVLEPVSLQNNTLVSESNNSSDIVPSSNGGGSSGDGGSSGSSSDDGGMSNVRKSESSVASSKKSDGGISLFGLHGVKVMPSCGESDGTFLPPLVSSYAPLLLALNFLKSSSRNTLALL
jgi:hypothetical protein